MTFFFIKFARTDNSNGVVRRLNQNCFCSKLSPLTTTLLMLFLMQKPMSLPLYCDKQQCHDLVLEQRSWPMSSAHHLNLVNILDKLIWKFLHGLNDYWVNRKYCYVTPKPMVQLSPWVKVNDLCTLHKGRQMDRHPGQRQSVSSSMGRDIILHKTWNSAMRIGETDD